MYRECIAFKDSEQFISNRLHVRVCCAVKFFVVKLLCWKLRDGSGTVFGGRWLEAFELLDCSHLSRPRDLQHARWIRWRRNLTQVQLIYGNLWLSSEKFLKRRFTAVQFVDVGRESDLSRKLLSFDFRSISKRLKLIGINIWFVGR